MVTFMFFDEDKFWPQNCESEREDEEICSHLYDKIANEIFCHEEFMMIDQVALVRSKKHVATVNI